MYLSLKLDLSQKSQWDISCLVIFLQKTPATCLLTYRTHSTADIGKRYMYFWQGVLKELGELWGAWYKLLSDSSKNFSTAAPRYLLWQRERSRVLQSPYQCLSEPGQDRWDSVSFCCTATTGDCCGNKNESWTPKNTGKGSTEWFKILTSIWLLGSALSCSLTAFQCLTKKSL